MNLFAGRLDEEILSMAWQPQSKMSMAPAARYTSLQLEVGGRAGGVGGGAWAWVDAKCNVLARPTHSPHPASNCGTSFRA